MYFFNRLYRCVSVLVFASFSLNASAASYTVNESFNGSWEAIWSLPIASFIHTSSSHNLISGDSSIFINSSTQSVSVIDNIVNCVSCTITETFKNGDKIFFTHYLVDGALIQSTSNPGTVDNFYNGTVTITGGTGLFSGASGSGLFTAIDFGIYNIDSNGDWVSFNPNGNWQIELTYSVTAPVPEQESYAMMMLGILIVSFSKRKQKFMHNSQNA